MVASQENYRIQKWLLAVVIVLFIIKLLAWYFTNSVAILTDALEYTINVISGIIGLYSLRLAARPRDENHPYGHGKIEFISATIEGTLMVFSSFIIIYQAIHNLLNPHHDLQKLDYGILLIALSGVINLVIGLYAVKKGTENNSLALKATGKHTLTDAYATGAILVGLVLIYFLHWQWLDSIVAIVFAIIIFVTGYKVLRSSIAGIMDEADDDLLDQVITICNANRNENLVDMHNLRIIKYGTTLHLDFHITIPWYFNIHEGHSVIDDLDTVIKNKFGNAVEMFVHTDGCLPFSCKICDKKNCNERKFQFVQKIDWTLQTISSNQKHQIAE